MLFQYFLIESPLRAFFVKFYSCFRGIIWHYCVMRLQVTRSKNSCTYYVAKSFRTLEGEWNAVDSWAKSIEKLKILPKNRKLLIILQKRQRYDYRKR